MSLSDLKSIFRDIERVDWRQLVHAYGRAEDVPVMLWRALSDNAEERTHGWNGVWGALNHQGDFYDSTVATIPFFIRFLTCEEIPCREKFLSYLYDRYLDAENYGGDPLLDDPPGGEDIPTPMRIADEASEATEELEEPDSESMRRMDLCAWQTGRAIRAGLPVYASLLNHPQNEIAGNAANLMLLWRESREPAKAALRAIIDAEKDSVIKAELLLKYGVYGSTRDLDAFRYWTAGTEPMEVRVAAAICWARAIEPAPLPDEVHALLEAATAPHCQVFADLPWLGVYHRGPWTLPSNLAYVVLRLATNNHNELRWRAIQGLMPGRKVEQWLRREATCPILASALTDVHNKVRAAAAFALAEIGEQTILFCPDIIERLIVAVDDQDEGASGHAARLLATLTTHLNSKQKALALKGIKAASKRFRQPAKYVHFMSTGIQAASFLTTQHNSIRQPVEWTLERLWQAYAFPGREDNILKPAVLNLRIASAYKANLRQVIQSAVDTLTLARDRNAVLGAAKWLTTLGPIAEMALEAVDSCGGGKFDTYVDGQMARVRRLIQDAIEFEATNRPMTVDTSPVDELKQQVSEGTMYSLEPWRALIEHNNWLIRFHAASAVPHVGEILRRNPSFSQELRAILQPLLLDEAFDVISIAGEFVYEDEIYQWRRQRRSVPAAAIQALFALDITFESDHLVDAMLREAMAPHIRCGETVIVSEYLGAEWRRACESVPGRLVAGELRVRGARQRCLRSMWSGEKYDPLFAVAERKLRNAILFLSERLTPHDEL